MTLKERSIAAERDILDRAFAYIRRNGSDSISAQLHAAAEVIAEQRAEIERLEAAERRLKAMMPLFEQARDALPAISEASRRLHNIDPMLADRMDDVGIASRWVAIDAARKEKP